jgi:tetratricopeptide (TPR) repeat protein
MRLRRDLVASFVAGVACLTIGCAGRSAPPSRFIIRDGAGPLRVTIPTATSRVDRAQIEKARREALAKRDAERPAPLPSVEATDARLRVALDSLHRHETAATHIQVAEEYRRLHVEDAAFDHFSEALALDHKNVAAFEGRARVWRDWGFIAPALSDAYRARYYGPDRPEVYNTLGTILERAGQCDAARSAYSAATARDEKAHWAHANLTRLDVLDANCRSKVR